MSDSRLNGKRVVVSGSSKGLGRAFALALAAHGAHVLVNGTDAAAVADVVGTILGAGGVAASVVGSVADDDVAAELVRTCVDRFGGIDVAITNAGITRHKPLMETTPERFDETIAVNLRGTWSVCRHAALAMRETGGLLLLIPSASAFTKADGHSSYAASKAGVMGLMYSLSGELARYAIRVNAFGPTAVTAMTAPRVDVVRDQAVAAGEAPPSAASLGYGDPDDVAKAVVYLCSDDAAQLCNQFVRFNGRRLALWRHPAEALLIDRDHWSVDDIAERFPRHQEPVCSPTPSSAPS